MGQRNTRPVIAILLTLINLPKDLFQKDRPRDTLRPRLGLEREERGSFIFVAFVWNWWELKEVASDHELHDQFVTINVTSVPRRITCIPPKGLSPSRS